MKLAKKLSDNQYFFLFLSIPEINSFVRAMKKENEFIESNVYSNYLNLSITSCLPTDFYLSI